MQFLILIKQACKQAQSYSSSKLQPGLVLIYIWCNTYILSTKRSTLDQIWFCCCFLVCSKCLRLFETFTIFWPNFPGRRDLDIQSELFESRRVADIWHIWILHPVEPILPDHPCKIVHKSTFWLLLRKFGFNQWYHASFVGHQFFFSIIWSSSKLRLPSAPSPFRLIIGCPMFSPLNRY